MKNKTLIALCAILGLSFAQNAIAKESFDERVYITPHASYLWLDDDRVTSRNDYGLGIGVGKAISEDFNLELKGFFNSYEHGDIRSTKTNYQWDTFGASIDLLYFLKRDEISPYLVSGIGIMDSRVHGKNAVGIIGEAGVGLAYDLNNDSGMSLRSDVRYRYNSNFNNNLTNNNADEYNDLVVSVALVIPLGKASSKVKKAVTDGRKSDSDRDVVADYKDKCPNTRRGVKVNTKCCNLSIKLSGVNFLSGSVSLTSSSKTILDKLAKTINLSGRDDKIEIQGHTSSDGAESTNKMLSQKRAQAVVDYLKTKGIDNKITAKGYGEERLIADESTLRGRLQNRRVELVWK
jgi:OOP family OmpA-OmpF porin